MAPENYPAGRPGLTRSGRRYCGAVPTLSATPPVALTIAGSDSGGGAGAQADLKTFGALGVHGTSALTAVTAQNTAEVRGVVALEPSFIRLQVETVLDDFTVGSVKNGDAGDGRHRGGGGRDGRRRAPHPTGGRPRLGVLEWSRPSWIPTGWRRTSPTLAPCARGNTQPAARRRCSVAWPSSS